jgi:hypothetical protein
MRPPLLLAPVIGIVAAVVLPASDGAFAAGLMAAVLVIVIASMVGSAAVVPAGALASTLARAVVERLIPRTTQSDPDARGHTRPRAPGVLLPAV